MTLPLWKLWCATGIDWTNSISIPIISGQAHAPARCRLQKRHLSLRTFGSARDGKSLRFCNNLTVWPLIDSWRKKRGMLQFDRQKLECTLATSLMLRRAFAATTPTQGKPRAIGFSECFRQAMPETYACQLFGCSGLAGLCVKLRWLCAMHSVSALMWPMVFLAVQTFVSQCGLLRAGWRPAPADLVWTRLRAVSPAAS